MSLGPRSRLRKENVDGVIVVSFTDTKLVAEDQIQEVGDELTRLSMTAPRKRSSSTSATSSTVPRPCWVNW